ncbi:MAG: hypothetical protein FWB85_11180, partial [Chitinispirillia bacterium]|nr:hypothetical protein [Chitinispirillia bacterium]
DSRDGQRYRAVKIGNLTWMAQNLNFAADNSWCFGDDGSNCDKYGRLYDMDAARAACPAPWRLPDDDDWDDLTEAGGGKDAVGKKLKSKTGWDLCPQDDDEDELVGCDGNGTDELGFSAYPGGACWVVEKCGYVGILGGWWSYADRGEDRGRVLGIVSPSDGIDGDSVGKKGRFSVRCVLGKLPEDPSGDVSSEDAAAATAAVLARAAAQEAAEEAAREAMARRIADSAAAAFAMAANVPNPVPAGYRLFEMFTGDLNGDGQEDVVLIIKGTDRNKIVKCEERGESGDAGNRMVDINGRGIIIDFKEGNGYRRVLENRDCLSSEIDDHLRTYPYDIRIEKGSLFIKYGSSRFDECHYNFKYRNSDFELIGYDHHEMGGSMTVIKTVSVNYLSRKALIKERPSGTGKFTETWKSFAGPVPPKLRDETYIGCFDALSKLGID